MDLAVLIASAVRAQEWPRFRGPNGSGVSPAQDPPIEMDRKHNLRWKRSLPFARSSPILVAMSSKDRGLVALDLIRLSPGGEVRELWRIEKSLARIATPRLWEYSSGSGRIGTWPDRLPGLPGGSS